METFKNNHDHSVIIVGAGIIGLNIAYLLSSKGIPCEVFEQQSAPLLGASKVAAGIAEFSLWNKEPSEWISLAKDALSQHELLQKELWDFCKINYIEWKQGIRVAKTQALKEHYLKNIPIHQNEIPDPSHHPRWLNHDVLRKSEPLLHKDQLGGILEPRIGSVNVPLMGKALYESAKALGASFHFNSPVEKYISNQGMIQGVMAQGQFYPASQVIIAAGLGTRDLDPLYPLFSIKGQVISLEVEKPLIDHVVFAPNIYLLPRKQSDHNSIIIGSTSERNETPGFTLSGGVSLLTRALVLLPSIRNITWDKIEGWHGFRPRTPHRVPYIEEHPSLKNLYIAAGHGSRGILLGPITAQKILSLIIK